MDSTQHTTVHSLVMLPMDLLRFKQCKCSFRKKSNIIWIRYSTHILYHATETKRNEAIIYIRVKLLSRYINWSNEWAMHNIITGKRAQGVVHSYALLQPLETMQETMMLLTFSKGNRMTRKQSIAVRPFYLLHFIVQAHIQWSVFSKLNSDRLMEEKWQKWKLEGMPEPIYFLQSMT